MVTGVDFLCSSVPSNNISQNQNFQVADPTSQPHNHNHHQHRCCCCCCRPHSTTVLPAESSTDSCGSQQSLPPGGKERLHFVGIRPEVQARKGGW